MKHVPQREETHSGLLSTLHRVHSHEQGDRNRDAVSEKGLREPGSGRSCKFYRWQLRLQTKGLYLCVASIERTLDQRLSLLNRAGHT